MGPTKARERMASPESSDRGEAWILVRRHAAACLLAGMGSFCLSPAWAQTLSESAKLLPEDGAAFDNFGIGASISGDLALVGAARDDDLGTDSGSAYVFARTPSGWVQEAKLLPQDGAAFDFFGFSVSLEGDRALVGANEDDDDQAWNAGSAYVFARTPSGWVEEAKLLPPDGAAGDHFGVSVSLSGDRALVGALFNDGLMSFSGSAYVFARTPSGWALEAKLLPQDGVGIDQFGGSVSLGGDLALVGASGDDEQGFFSGSAYVFARTPSGWALEAKLLPQDGEDLDRFGEAVSLAGQRALVGSPWSGSAYVFARTPSGWVEEAKLLPHDPEVSGQFGKSVSLAGDRALVGRFSGSAYVFARTPSGWVEEAKLVPQDITSFGGFGGDAVSLAGNRALVGARREDAQGLDSGSAFVFELGGSFEIMSECTGNSGSLAASGEPVLGSTVTFAMDQGQVPGVFPVLAVSLDAVAGWPPCGVPVPGVGEILIGFTPPDPVAVLGGANPWPGTPFDFPIPLPTDVSLVGTTAYVQGIFADLGGLVPAEPLRATNGIALTIGL